MIWSLYKQVTTHAQGSEVHVGFLARRVHRGRAVRATTSMC